MSASSIRNMEIAVIGDLELVSALRLAGLRKTYPIQAERHIAEDVRKALDECMSDPDIGVIVMLEEYAEMVGDVVSQYRQGKSVLPVIVEVPSKRGTRHPDVVAYYKQFSREYLGFDIEL
ncbi:MAG: V-type ATP synthase subunit F [Dehalococcoidia bacterium]|nr:V-type ATP synthase subunit F [Dehalococcoidia bacterium]